jgi:serine/threonine protein kinase
MVEPKGELIGPSADMWQLGCVAYVMAYGQPPFGADRAAIVGCKVEYP